MSPGGAAVRRWSASATPGPRRPWDLTAPDVIRLVVLGAAYYLAAWLSLRASLVGGVVTPIWPPTGIALVAFLFIGFRIWPAVTVAAFLVNLPINSSVASAVLIAVGNTAAPLLAAWLLKATGFRRELDRLRDALSLVFLGALLAMTVSASFGAGALLLGDAITRDSLASTWTLWWAGDGTGVLVFAPLLLSLGHGRFLRWRQWLEMAVVIGGLAVVAYVVFQGEHQTVYLVFPFVIWAAVRFRQLGAALAALTVVVMAVWAAIDEVGPFADVSFLERMLTLQVYNAVVALTSFVLAAVMTERARALSAMTASLERERRITETLQRSLLPEQLPDVPGVAFASRYLPGGAGLQVGGDWFDVVSLPRGRVALTVGDVVGRGIGAAAAMGQLRVALRAYALETDSPAAVVERMSLLVGELEAGQMATLVYGVLDPDTGSFTYASAGHLPPLLIDADGRAQYLDEGRSLPLGLMRSTRSEAAATLRPGATLVLYTDGLVERRDGSITDGMEALRQAVEGQHDDLDVLCDRHVLAPPRPESDEDDVAVLAVRLLPVPEGDFELTLPAEPDRIISVRRAIRPWAAGLGAGAEETDDIVLAASEAVSNAIEHAYGPSGGTLDVAVSHLDGVVTIVVRDHGQWRQPRADEHGRGMQLMRSLVDEIDVQRTPDGTEVTLRRRLGARPESALGSAPAVDDEPAWDAEEATASVTVVRLTEDIDLANASELYHELIAEVGHDTGLVVDLSDVSYLDSAGVRLLYRVAERLAPRRQTFRVVAPEGSPVRRILTLTGFDGYTPIAETVEEATVGTSRHRGVSG